MVIETKPIIKDCEMNHGFISYWEGPVEVKHKGKKSLRIYRNYFQNNQKDQ